MYSYEDRIRAVKVYIKLGKRTGPTIRKLGYPTKNSLKRWHQEYERSLGLQVGYADRRSASALDVFAFKLSTRLKTESTKSRKQKRSLKQMHADLCVLGFEGSYDRVAAFARQWKVDQLDRVNSASKGTAAALESGFAQLWKSG